MASFWDKIIEFIKNLFKKPTTTTTTSTSTLPTPLDPPTGKLKGYGMVNMWMTLGGFDSFASSIKTSGCNCMSIELFGREEDGWINKQDVIRSKFTELMASVRKHGIVLFVNVVNWGSSSLTSQSDSWFQSWLDFIKSFGKANLIVQAAAEWSGTKAENWCKMAENTLVGFSLSWNKGSRPTTATSRYGYIDYHSASMSDYGPSDGRVICNTDSGILNEMQNGGVLGQTFITQKVIDFSTTPLKNGKSVNLYGYYHKQPDTEAIKTLGKIPFGGQPSTDYDIKNVKWVTDISAKNTQVDPTAVITSAQTDSGSMYPVWGTTWKWSPNDGYCDSKVAIAYKRPDGTWWAGRVDWNPIVRRDKLDLTVAHDPGSGHEFPAYGTPMMFFVYNEKAGTTGFRTKEVLVVWKSRSIVRRFTDFVAGGAKKMFR